MYLKKFLAICIDKLNDTINVRSAFFFVCAQIAQPLDWLVILI